MQVFSSRRIAGVLGLALCLLGVGCTANDDQVIPDGEPSTDVFGFDEDDSAEDLYFQALRLQSLGLLRRERMEQLQRQLAVVDEVYAGNPDHELLLRKALLSNLRLATAEVPRENIAVLEAVDAHAYGRRLHRGGVKAAAKGAEGVVLVAGMLGVPTSKTEALLMVAIPAGGYLVVKIGGMALKRAVFLLRNSRNADEVVESAARLGFNVQRVEDASALRTAIASESEALSANFEEVVASIPQTNTKAMVDSPPGPVTSMRSVEVRNQAPRSRINPTYKLGASDGGPGRWEKAPVRPKGAGYQHQVTGAPEGTEYALPARTPSGKVLFDGYKDGKLLDAKDWEKWPPADTRFWQDGVLDEARKQLDAAGSIPIEWHLSSEDKAEAVRELFEREDVRGITIKVTPKQ